MPLWSTELASTSVWIENFVGYVKDCDSWNTDFLSNRKPVSVHEPFALLPAHALPTYEYRVMS